MTDDDATQLQWEIVEEALPYLEWRDQVILNLRYLVDPPVSFRRISYLLGIGGARASQIEKRALQRLRKRIMVNGHIKDLEEIGIYMEKGYSSAHDYIFFDKTELTPVERKRLTAGYKFNSENYLTYSAD